MVRNALDRLRVEDQLPLHYKIGDIFSHDLTFIHDPMPLLLRVWNASQPELHTKAVLINLLVQTMSSNVQDFDCAATTAYTSSFRINSRSFAFIGGSLSARGRRRFSRSADRRGAGPRPGAVLRRRSSASARRREHAIQLPVAARQAPSRPPTLP